MPSGTTLLDDKSQITPWHISTEGTNRWNKREIKITFQQNCGGSSAGEKMNGDFARTEMSTSRNNKSTDTSAKTNELRIMMLGCEDRPPYGPLDNTANMFANLMASAVHEKVRLAQYNGVSDSTSSIDHLPTSLSIAIYNAKRSEYPINKEEWDWYNGIIIPGSFSGAYEEHDWITKLKDVIRSEIHPNRRKTLAVCFGHQLMAHAFQDFHESGATTTFGAKDELSSSNSSMTGLCVKCPHGHQAGRRTSRSTRAGSFIFNRLNAKRRYSSLTSRSSACSTSDHPEFGSRNSSLTADSLTREEICARVNADTIHDESDDVNDELNLLYTHGDMVASLPPFALPLAATDKVSIVSSAYFATTQDAQRFLREQQPCVNNNTFDSSVDTKIQRKSDVEVCSCDGNNKSSIPSPYALTFQAHPEYIGSENTFQNVVSILDELKMVPKLELQHAQKDAEQNAKCVLHDSLHVIMVVGTIFEWF